MSKWQQTKIKPYSLANWPVSRQFLMVYCSDAKLQKIDRCNVGRSNADWSVDRVQSKLEVQLALLMP